MSLYHWFVCIPLTWICEYMNGWHQDELSWTDAGTGIPTRANSLHGEGDGEKVSPVTLDGMRMGNFLPHGDGEALPDGEFSPLTFSFLIQRYASLLSIWEKKLWWVYVFEVFTLTANSQDFNCRILFTAKNGFPFSYMEMKMWLTVPTNKTCLYVSL